MAGRAGGIPLQMQDGVGGFLVDSVKDCAERTLWLLRHPDAARQLGARGKALVRDRFLLTRLIADELRLYAALLGRRPAGGGPAAKVGLAGEARDPVCGMRLVPDKALVAMYGGRSYLFCSQACRATFEAAPERVIASTAGSLSGWKTGGALWPTTGSPD